MSVGITWMLKQKKTCPCQYRGTACLQVLIFSVVRACAGEGVAKPVLCSWSPDSPRSHELLTHGRHVHWFCRNTLHCVIFLDNKEQQMDRKWLQIVVCKQPVLQRRSEVTWNRKELRQQWGFPGPPVDQWSWWKSIVEFKARILSSVCDFLFLQSGGIKFVRFSTLRWLQLEGYRGKLLTGMLSGSPESKQTKTTVTGFHWRCWLLRLQHSEGSESLRLLL